MWTSDVFRLTSRYALTLWLLSACGDDADSHETETALAYCSTLCDRAAACGLEAQFGGADGCPSTCTPPESCAASESSACRSELSALSCDDLSAGLLPPACSCAEPQDGAAGQTTTGSAPSVETDSGAGGELVDAGEQDGGGLPETDGGAPGADPCAELAACCLKVPDPVRRAVCEAAAAEGTAEACAFSLPTLTDACG